MSVLKNITWFFWSRISAFVALSFSAVFVTVALGLLSVVALFHPATAINMLGKVDSSLNKLFR